jgi:hypothetical protein
MAVNYTSAPNPGPFDARVTPFQAGWGGLPPTCLGHESASLICIEACQNSTLRETRQKETDLETIWRFHERSPYGGVSCVSLLI